MPAAVAHPCDRSSLEGALDAARLGLITPTLVGPAARIAAVAAEYQLDISPYPVIDAGFSQEAAEKAVALVRSGQAEVLMKGSLHTDELLGAVVKRETGLRTARRLSHCFVMDVPGHPDVIVITDAAMNIAPTLEDKVDIVQNAIDLVHALGVPEARVAILSAMETVNPKVPSTIEAAALCKMADRKQITGGILDGPLALDNAISLEAAADQADRLAGGGPGQRAGRARPRGRQHAREEPHLPGRCGLGRHRARREGSDRADQPRRLRAGAAGVVRRGGAAGARPARAGRQGRGMRTSAQR